MSQRSFDVIVAGLGAMGSATACHLAQRGRRVLGLDAWAPGHTLGSFHGESRIIRQLSEQPVYVPLVQRAYALWRELEARTSRQLLQTTGGLLIGSPDAALVPNARRTAETCRLPYEALSAAEVGRRFPAFALRESYVALLDPEAGYLLPERCVAAHLDVARASGATLRFEEPVLEWMPEGAGVRVITQRGSYLADQLMLNVGARSGVLLAELDLPLTVERQVLFWFEPGAGDGRYDPRAFPVYVHESESGRRCYGFPRLARGVKAAMRAEGDLVDDPEQVRRTVEDNEVEPLRQVLGGIVPGLAGAPVRESAVCLFTSTPDRHFLIDQHPRHPQVLISSPCSGSGFKFSSVIGELQADLLTEGRAEFDLAPFRLARMGGIHG